MRPFTSTKPNDVSKVAEGVTGRLAWTKQAGAMLRELWDLGIPNGKADVGLGSVDNTSDAAKPVSTATSTALGGKADLSGGLVPVAQIPSLAIGKIVDLTTKLAGKADLVDGKVPAAQLPTASSSSAVSSVAGRTGAVVLAAVDIASGVLALARMPGGTPTYVDYAAVDDYAAASAWPAARPASRGPVLCTGPSSAFVVGQAPLTWMTDRDQALRETA